MKLKLLNRQIDPYGTIPMDSRRMRQVIYFNEMSKDLPEGDFVECGIGLARTFLILGFLIEGQRHRRLWGFDSFEGFPEPSIEDSSERNPKKGQWKCITPKDIHKIFRVAGVNESPIIIKGYFENTIQKYKGKIALLHLDVDLYQSYKDCFELITYVVPHGVVLFDEYNSNKFPGATQAIDEFLYVYGTSYKLQEFMGKYYFRKI
jgi:O-methyltransferase